MSKRRLTDHLLLQMALAGLLAGFIRLVYVTSRKTSHIDPTALPYITGRDNGIFAFWHGRMMLLPPLYTSPRKAHILISRHRDGLLISRVIAHFGQGTVSGSTNKRGSEAVREIRQIIKAGDNLGITPDGPRGPNQTVSRGVIAVARMAGKPVIPAAFSTTRCRRMKSWDRFMLALPFGHIILHIGKPIDILAYDNEEAARAALENAMNELTHKADQEAGHV